MSTNKVDYGYCDDCRVPLEPVFFIEEETKIEHGVMFKTGRKRRAVSHLTCLSCLKNFCVDDSFDSIWFK